MKLLFAILFLLIPSWVFAGEYGYLEVTVLERNPQHNTPVNLKINGVQVLSFSHSTAQPLLIEINGSYLSKSPSTPLSSDYKNLQQGCLFKFKISYSFDKKSWINLGVFEAPTNQVQASLPIGLCDGMLCSRNKQIQNHLKSIEETRWKKAVASVGRWLQEAERKEREEFAALKAQVAENRKAENMSPQLEDDIKAIDGDMANLSEQEVPEVDVPKFTDQNIDEMISDAIDAGQVDNLISDLQNEEKLHDACLSAGPTTQYLCQNYGGFGWIGAAAEAVSIGLAENPDQAAVAMENRILDPQVRSSLQSSRERIAEMRLRTQQVLNLKRSEAMWSKAANVARAGAIFTPLNDVVDFCEAMTGRVMCISSGEQLTSAERFMAVLGMIAGNRMFWEGLTAEARLGVLRDKVAVDSVEMLLNLKIKTPFGDATQELTQRALSARSRVEEGAKVYRLGTKGKSQTGHQAQFWSLEHPLALEYAKKYGIPKENIHNADFIEIAIVKKDSQFVTRTAPPAGGNPGGGVEIVVPEGGVTIQSHSSF